MRLETKGNRLVRAIDGRPVIPRGPTVIRWPWERKRPEFDLGILDRVTRYRDHGGWGADAVTFWVDSDRVEDGSFQPIADKAVEIVIKNDAYLILAYHAPHNMKHPSRIDERGIDAMRELARRFGAVGNVLYIAQSEPGKMAPDNRALTWKELKPWLVRTIDAIRAIAPESVIGIPGTNWSQNFDGLLADPINRPNLFVQPHLYRHGITTLARLLKARKVFEVAERWPVIIGEFGDKEWPDELTQELEERFIGWQAWNAADIGDPVMLIDPDKVVPNSYGKQIMQALSRGDKMPPTKPTPRPITVPFRVNTGGKEVGEWVGDVPWDDSTPYGHVLGSRGGASFYSGPVEGDLPREVLGSELWGVGEYHFRVQPGICDVVLHFAETYTRITQPGQRVFAVKVGDYPVEVDPFANVGGFGVQSSVTYKQVPVTDELVIEFTPIVEQPAIKGIEILPSIELPEEGGTELERVWAEIHNLKWRVEALERK